MPTIREFISSEAGARFFGVYDRLLDRWPADREVRDIETAFGTTRVTSVGPQGAAPLVFLPGGGASAMGWTEVARRLGADRRVIAVDLIGDIGRSVPGASPPRTPADLVAWLSQVLDALPGADPGRPIVVGHSYGAMIAVAHALAEPDRIGRLVLLDPTSVFGGMKVGYLLHAIPVLARPTAARQRRFLEWETAGIALDPDWLDLLTRGAGEFPSSRPVVPRRPRRSALDALAVPTAVILAGRSRVHDAAQIARRAERTPAVTDVHVIADASHHGLPMHPATELAATLRAVLD
ncbi:alpha/beta fold hydrolase [Gordonia soli]|uniref:Putative hydrolase n=1 Tax=Gordonia soli NBRC 108243 TaxID=1223545 RepID=M0QFL4_9ACTN|nr:alpha/beta hydrolase [Gordonia soli]GAC67254.1 putative hydrolase [Gordonia soli NBRC 108243]